MMKATFCVDLGGTKTAWALYDEKGNELTYHRFATEPEKGADDLIERLYADAEKTVKDYEIVGGCIASPGPLDLKKGSIVYIATMGWRDVPLVEKMTRRFGIAFKLINDCDAGALGVAHRPEFASYPNVCYMSVSTGVGGGIVIDGKIYTGRGDAGNFGHMPIPRDGLVCPCGQTDCLELYASGSGMEKRYLAKTGKALTCYEIETLAKSGDATATGIFEDASNALATAGQLIRNTLNPDLIVLGGSVCRAGEMVWGKIANEQTVGFAPEDGKQVLYGAYIFALQK